MSDIAQPNEIADIEQPCEVVMFIDGKTNQGAKMGKLQLKSLSNDTLINCMIWEESLNKLDKKIFNTGNIVQVLKYKQNPAFNNYIVNDIKLIKEAKNGLDAEQREQLFSAIVEYANEIEDEDLKKYVTELLFEHEEKFKTAPAAKLMHHNYIGGLLEHTFECLEIAKLLINNLYKEIDKSQLYAACILHDFGKIFEYNIDTQTGLIEYEENFPKEWITHSQWGFSNCMTRGFTNVARMIAAHHGRSDWGAIIDLNEKGLDPMLYILHHIDDLSAKFGKITFRDI